MTLAIYPLPEPCEDEGQRLRRSRVAMPRAGKSLVTLDQNDPAAPSFEDLSGQIVAIATTADMAAFQALFQHYSPRIRAYLIKLTRNSQAAEDLMQETMLAIWRKAGQYDPSRGMASAWVFTIARNIWIDAWRKQRRPEFDPDDPALAAEPEPDAMRRMEDKQSYAALHRAMLDLPKDQVDLIKLSFFEDASHSTIAKRMGLPIGTVKSRIRLAFARLRKALEEAK